MSRIRFYDAPVTRQHRDPLMQIREAALDLECAVIEKRPITSDALLNVCALIQAAINRQLKKSVRNV